MGGLADDVLAGGGYAFGNLSPFATQGGCNGPRPFACASDGDAWVGNLLSGPPEASVCKSANDTDIGPFRDRAPARRGGFLESNRCGLHGCCDLFCCVLCILLGCAKTDQPLPSEALSR